MGTEYLTSSPHQYADEIVYPISMIIYADFIMQCECVHMLQGLHKVDELVQVPQSVTEQ